MQISLILAIGKQAAIGKQQRLPWKLTADLQHFRELTEGHTVLMGHNTFSSIGSALPKRKNLLLSRQLELPPANVQLFTQIEAAIYWSRRHGESKLFIAGGAEVYRYCLQYKLADYLYLTQVDYDGDADVFLPELDLQQWQLVKREQHQADAKNQYNFCFEEYTILA